MAAIDDLLDRILDESLREEIRSELNVIRGTQELGLVFERHLPESVWLPSHPIEVGSRVVRRDNETSPEWTVVGLAKGKAKLERVDGETTLTESAPINRLSVVSALGQPIYPGLNEVGRLEQGGDKPSHVVISGENFYALQALRYACAEQVDVIYIDPPYNTGATDWQYNNDYVDAKDRYRHSKWLSFIEKRILIARDLLRPNGVLIVTIDFHEHHRLVMLLEQRMPEFEAVSVAIQHNAKGRQGDNFSITHEYAVFLTRRGQSVIAPEKLDTIRWSILRDGGTDSTRQFGPGSNTFYPVYVDPATGEIVGFGDVLPDDEHPDAANTPGPDGTIAVWPIDTGGTERKWRYQRWTVEATELRARAITKGKSKGSFIIEIGKHEGPTKSVWTGPHLDASSHGTKLLKALVPDNRFDYPKSLYAVADCLYAVVHDRPNALILDFFAGSGTTAHATMLLNAEDGGERRCIAVTNNEVAADEQGDLRAKGAHPGDAKWEASGIFARATRPRVEAAITGATRGGDALKGKYRSGTSWSDGFAENVRFYELEYLDRDLIHAGLCFEAIDPLLWIRAGATGPSATNDTTGWSVPDGARYGVLFDPDAWIGFAAAVQASETVRLAYVVTDSDAVLQRVAAELPSEIETVRLYDSYLANGERHTRDAGS